MLVNDKLIGRIQNAKEVVGAGSVHIPTANFCLSTDSEEWNLTDEIVHT